MRTYKWLAASSSSSESASASQGRLVSINKWEFASQIGTVTLNYESDGSPALLGETRLEAPSRVLLLSLLLLPTFTFVGLDLFKM